MVVPHSSLNTLACSSRAIGPKRGPRVLSSRRFPTGYGPTVLHCVCGSRRCSARCLSSPDELVRVAALPLIGQGPCSTVAMAAATETIVGERLIMPELRRIDDYLLWSRRAQQVLVQWDQWSMVSGILVKPKDPATVDGWIRRDQKALTSLTMKVADPLYISGKLQEKETSREVWLQLHTMFDEWAADNIMQKRKEWNTYRMNPCRTFHAHIEAVQRLAFELGAMGKSESDHEQAYKMLESVPSLYDNVLQPLRSSMDLRNLDLSLVMRRLTQLDLQIQPQPEPPVVMNVVGFRGRGRVGGRGRSRDRGRGGGQRSAGLYQATTPPPHSTVSSESTGSVCHYCGKLGHTERECYVKYPDRAPSDWGHHERRRRDFHARNTARNQSVNMVDSISSQFRRTVELDDDSYVNCVDDRNMKRESNGVWLLDSGATQHLTFSRDVFSSYRPSDETVFGVGQSRMKAVGRGIVPMRWHFPDGSSIVRDLDDVWHVPNIERQFISLASLLELPDTGVEWRDGHFYVQATWRTAALRQHWRACWSPFILGISGARPNWGASCSSIPLTI